MRYYEDPASGSIYTLEELEQMIQGIGIDLRTLLGTLTLLPHSTCRLLEEAVAVATAAERQGHRSWFGTWA
jgi:hypothetical protein